MKLLRSLGIAISAYSVIPVPRFDWSRENMRFSLCFLPVVGAIAGLSLFLWRLFCGRMDIGNVLFAAGATLIPLLLTGGIHMDGYCDCVDAISSRRDRKKMLEILKDPHAGAFAVIWCAAYLLAVFGLYSELWRAALICAASCGFVLSRALAALSAVLTQSAASEGFLVSFTSGAHKKAVVISMGATALLASAAMIASSPLAGSAGVLFAAASFFLYRNMAIRKFGGVTGDTTGYFIQICELAILAGIFSGSLIKGF
ncbi:MAG: adenosylcobinamide-GDP ribazoletransferase [Acidobacteriota bacterium]|jgi:adenosylcobinamide-GDP ribazoletransferase|nr:adenosylcobinamide-GDP ribazoletransferase [Acidobacteriota bacterium]